MMSFQPGKPIVGSDGEAPGSLAYAFSHLNEIYEDLRDESLGNRQYRQSGFTGS
jgi:hypothetical protein